MNELTQFLGTLGGISALFLVFFKIIYNLGKKEKQNEIEYKTFRYNRRKIKNIIATQNWLRKLSDSAIDKLLHKNKK
tara:strand:+ start:468 stop:698 length:231 start_codon:yes stop_codon:yes gene_type:complete